MEKGQKKGPTSLPEPAKTAEHFYDFLEGFRYSFFARHGTIFPDKKQFHAVLKREFDRVYKKKVGQKAHFVHKSSENSNNEKSY